MTLLTLNSGQAFIIAAAMTVMMIMAANSVLAKEMTIGDLAMINLHDSIVYSAEFLGFVYREIRAP